MAGNGRSMTTRGGAISVAGGSGPVLSIGVRIEGVEKTTAEFKAVRRDINAAMRAAQEKVGKQHVLPIMTTRLAPVAGKWAGTLYVRRDRVDVFIGARLRGQLNRALGWLDFGGRRPRDAHVRKGPHVMVRTLQEQQPKIRGDIGDAVLDEFREKGFEVS